jgi:hypothetical protein
MNQHGLNLMYYGLLILFYTLNPDLSRSLLTITKSFSLKFLFYNSTSNIDIESEEIEYDNLNPTFFNKKVITS